MLLTYDISDLIKEPKGSSLAATTDTLHKSKSPAICANTRTCDSTAFHRSSRSLRPSSPLSSGRYTILEPFPADQRSLLNTAFDDAILLAAVAARPPLGRLGHGQRKRIYDEYFREEDAATV